MDRKRSYEDGCALAQALDLVGERWALLVMRELMFGPKRFTDLKRDLPAIATNVLAQRLQGLEAAGVTTDRGHIVVDDTLQTSVPHIFAAGDITGRVMLVQALELPQEICRALHLLRADGVLDDHVAIGLPVQEVLFGQYAQWQLLLNIAQLRLLVPSTGARADVLVRAPDGTCLGDVTPPLLAAVLPAGATGRL